ncbi:DotD/TraH family lipoprotein [Telmatospirillum siberiense]|uniref:Uncharacterized protein n=1 Tax=Telmatospirillum siberiense TaxID=382514 RepID=A0A2N3PLW7_9PROT|nr:DotD/TraH family lipoprotein [Telmatospirillum siberiense]PKU21386.1 hypothetical protein CWS72_26945 [Telmatospirillum siberiense]
MRRITGLLTSGFVMFVSACAAPTPPPAPPKESALEESARKVSEAMDLLARTQASVEQSKHGVPPALPEPTGDLAVSLSVDFTGPMLAVVRQVAGRLGYDVTEIGASPTVPITVAIHTTGHPAQNILQDIAAQAGAQADIVASPRRRVIEIHYSSETPPTGTMAPAQSVPGFGPGSNARPTPLVPPRHPS